jgi:hypothetical protein
MVNGVRIAALLGCFLLATLACAHAPAEAPLPAQEAAPPATAASMVPGPGGLLELPFCPDPSTAPKDCVAHNGLPDPRCTAGATAADDLEVICHQSTASRRCNFSKATREAMFQAYRLSSPEPPGSYELDHLIPLELGGANTLDNLWPEAAAPAPGFHEKDWLENYLHKQVCGGSLALATARWLIAGDWVSAYRRLAANPSPNPARYPVPRLRGGASDVQTQ